MVPFFVAETTTVGEGDPQCQFGDTQPEGQRPSAVRDFIRSTPILGLRRMGRNAASQS